MTSTQHIPTPDSATRPIELGFALVDERELAGFARHERLTRDDYLAQLGEASDCVVLPDDAEPTHFFLGSEFCEHLLPNVESIDRAVALCERWGLTFGLVTPIACDGLFDPLRAALRRLPAGSEVTVNDWGVARLVQREFPELRPVAGRLLGKMLKDPRLPSATWARMYPNGLRAGPFRDILDGLGIGRLELDFPPFGAADMYAGIDFPVGVRAPYGYIAKGRICKLGSLSLDMPEKFSPGHKCHRECLGFNEVGARPGTHELPTSQRGNTMYYRHAKGMAAAVAEAVNNGWVSRIVLSGA
ncbi:hypothetical protein [Aromatoleum evansii]|uniref:hypothetical protein n=1 Tax=Aromatoleum evansii TaxID=59406 RepID=UPI00145D9D85|nr:hypothetical protein [Aromatoleum evansii]NMG31349.1 hypothetical protein [Aromatoleum evansii]